MSAWRGGYLREAFLLTEAEQGQGGTQGSYGVNEMGKRLRLTLPAGNVDWFLNESSCLSYFSRCAGFNLRLGRYKVHVWWLWENCHLCPFSIVPVSHNWLQLNHISKWRAVSSWRVGPQVNNTVAAARRTSPTPENIWFQESQFVSWLICEDVRRQLVLWIITLKI